MVRWYRALWLRVGMALLGWPHLIDVLLGVNRVRSPGTPKHAVWKTGRTTLWRFERKRQETAEVPILLVHSLISQPTILDLAPGSSLVGALLDAGFDVYVLDWGEFGPGDAEHGFSRYADQLIEAEKRALETSGARKIHLVGYCLGGTLCMARTAARRHDSLASLSLLATPVDFAVPSPLHTLLSHRLLKPVLFLDGSGGVPGSVVRESFHLLRPQALRSVATAFSHRRDRAAWPIYANLARWVWEHRRLPGGVFFDLVDLFRYNRLFEGSWEIAGDVTSLGSIKVPILNVMAARDHIVPTGSSQSLSAVEGLDCEVLSFPTGHVSMISGTTARDEMWPALTRWLLAHSDDLGSRTAGEGINERP